MNKFVSLFLMIAAIFIVIGVVSDDSDAAIGDEFESGDFRYVVISNENVSVLEYFGNLPHIDIPDTVTYDNNEYKIVELNNDFTTYMSDAITSIHLPKYLDYFGEYLLDSFDSLETITVSEDNIRFYAEDGVLFEDDGYDLCLIVCPVKKEGSYVVPDGVTSIKDYAFENCKRLTSITIPASVSDIDDSSVFYGTYVLANIIVSENNPTYSSRDGVLYDDVTGTLITYPLGKIGTTYTVKDGTIRIGDYSFFENRNLTKVILPESVTHIESGAFENSSIMEIDLPDTLEHIGDYAFYSSDIRKISIPGSIKNLDHTFKECYGLKEVTLEEGVETLFYTFMDCYALESISIPSTVTDITGAFENCTMLRSITVNEENLFYRTVDGVLFNKDGTELILYPSNRSESEYTIPNGVVTIIGNAFIQCVNIRTLTVAASVTNFDEIGLSQFPHLETIIVEDGNDHR